MSENTTEQESTAEIRREESQTVTRVVREDDEVRLKIVGSEELTLGIDDYEDVLKELRRTKWLLSDEEKLESEETVMEIDGQFMGKGECHECHYEGYLVENDIGTVYCPKCRSTNVGWPVR